MVPYLLLVMLCNPARIYQGVVLPVLVDPKSLNYFFEDFNCFDSIDLMFCQVQNTEK